jgi:hypothetical protein
MTELTRQPVTQEEVERLMEEHAQHLASLPTDELLGRELESVRQDAIDRRLKDYYCELRDGQRLPEEEKWFLG